MRLRLRVRWTFRHPLSPLSAWAAGVASTVTIALSEAGEGVTDVAFSQTGACVHGCCDQCDVVRTLTRRCGPTCVAGIPAEDAHGNRGVVKTTRDGWKSRIFMGIKQMLGYGLEITSESS